MIKYDTKKLFVACRVYDVETETEPWVQYESLGKIEHQIIVDPKRVLLLEEWVEGKNYYIDCKTRRIVQPMNYQYSFESHSSCCSTLYLSDYPLGPLSDERRQYFADKSREVSFVMPFNEFIRERLGVEYTEVTLAEATALLRLINMTAGRCFKLSFSPEEAEHQISKKVYKRKSHIKTKK